MDNKFLMKPILIYGPRKAGTSLLQNLLDGTKDILVIPEELKIKKILRYKGKEKSDSFFEHGRSIFTKNFIMNPKIRLKDNFFRMGTLKKESIDDKIDTNYYIKKSNEILQKNLEEWKEIIQEDVLNFYNSLKRKQPYKFWASKEVGDHPKKIKQFFKKIFPKSRFIFIIRQPRYVVRSIILQRKRNNIKLTTKQIFHEYLKVQHIINYYYENKDRNFHILVFYEDLIKDTEKNMKIISSYLGIRFSDIMDDPTLLGEKTKVLTSSRNEKSVFQKNNRWTDKLTLREIIGIITAILYSRFNILFKKDYVSYKKLKKSVSLDNI